MKFVTATIAAPILAAFNSGCCNHPTDEELIRRFERDRAAFEQLAADLHTETGILPMVRADGESTLSHERAVDYQRRLQKLGLIEAIQATAEEVVLHVSECPFPSHSVKGYCHDMRSRAQLGSAGELSRLKDGEYRHIEGYWYLYYKEGGS